MNFILKILKNFLSIFSFKEVIIEKKSTPIKRVSKTISSKKNNNHQLQKKQQYKKSKNHKTPSFLLSMEPPAKVEQIVMAVRTNIFLLKSISEQFDLINLYPLQYDKLKKLKEQSEGTLQLLDILDFDSPYYEVTLLTIINHTNVISNLSSKL